MRQLLHFLILDRDRRCALSTRSAAGWLLPTAACPSGTRAAAAASRALNTLGLNGDVIGQWSARLTADARSIDSLVVVCADCVTGLVADHTSIPVDDLITSPALLDYQAWAVRRTFADRPSERVGPFETLSWLDDAMRWILDVLGVRSFDRLTMHRATGWEVVLGVSTPDRRWYFKGLTAQRAIEAHLTAALASRSPGSFAPSLAIQPGLDDSVRWLAVGCPGTPLTARLTCEPVARTTHELARVQEWIGDARSLQHVPPRLDLAALNRWSQDVVDRSRYPCAVEAIDRAVGDVLAARLPDRWIPLDLDPANVLVDDDGNVAFIDLDDSFVGPAPLAAATLARRVRARQTHETITGGADVVRLAYAQASKGSPTPRIWAALDTVAVVVEARLAWQRLVTARGRGELHGPVDLVLDRIRARLARALTE